jgi:hypothetical protein
MDFSFMTLRSLRLTTFVALIIAPAFLSAQETTASEDERIEQLVRSEASEWYTPKNSVTVGFRVLTSGANVQFGKLGSIYGSIPITDRVAPASAGRVNRVYDNGSVGVDAPRASEVDANGVQKSVPGERFKTYTTTTTPVLDENGVQVGTKTDTVLSSDIPSYNPEVTRVWGYATPEQATAENGYIAMSSYSATSDGGSFSKKEGMSIGVEMQFAHALRKFGKRVELSLVAGVAINGINSKTAGDVQSTLHTFTDYYSLHGQTAPPTSIAAPYSAPTPLDENGYEATVPLGATPDHSATPSAVVGAATVHGRWQIKGAYFMFRVGPSLRAQFTDRFGVSAGLGLAAAYAGTHYSAIETMEVPNVGTVLTNLANDQDSDATKFLGGYFADFNVDWAANDTLAIYGGVSAQKFGDYIQTLGERDARIDLGSSVGLRGGINIKF